LNSTGARIWELLQSGVTPAAAVETLATEFQIDSLQAKQAVDELIGALEVEGLIE
jgi:hypothetical protein